MTAETATEEAVLRLLLHQAGAAGYYQKAHIRAAMVRWRDTTAERVAAEQGLTRAREAERAAYEYLAGSLMAIHPQMGVAADADPEAWLAALTRLVAADGDSAPAVRRPLPRRRRALPRPDAG